ncbi:unnamed protein product [Fasciola hepatica]|uniref:Saposin B-type domain-containing protein n=1 Tax=Fasciola hepatica TaxID=6192 RepID=A0ABC9HGJ3_FASHE
MCSRNVTKHKQAEKQLTEHVARQLDGMAMCTLCKLIQKSVDIRRFPVFTAQKMFSIQGSCHLHELWDESDGVCLQSDGCPLSQPTEVFQHTK